MTEVKIGLIVSAKSPGRAYLEAQPIEILGEEAAKFPFMGIYEVVGKIKRVNHPHRGEK